MQLFVFEHKSRQWSLIGYILINIQLSVVFNREPAPQAQRSSSDGLSQELDEMAAELAQVLEQAKDTSTSSTCSSSSLRLSGSELAAHIAVVKGEEVEQGEETAILRVNLATAVPILVVNSYEDPEVP